MAAEFLDLDDFWVMQKEQKRCDYGGQTVRMRGKLVKLCPHWCFSTLNPYVEAYRSTVSEGGTVVIPVTDIDMSLGEMLMKVFPHILSDHQTEDILLSKFDHLAVSAFTCYDRFHRTCTQTFDVPIIGHLLISDEAQLHNEPKQPMRQQQHMRWNGQLYRMDRIYTLHTSGSTSILKDYGPLVLEAPKFPDAATRELNFSLLPSRGWRFAADRLFHGHTNVQLQGRSWRFFADRLFHGHTHVELQGCGDGGSPYLVSSATSAARRRRRNGGGGGGGVVIDLHRPTRVTHIGIAAARPPAALFPQLIREPAGRAEGGEGEAPAHAGGKWKGGCLRKSQARGGSVYVIGAVSGSVDPAHCLGGVSERR
jgi:hypothetical protein